MPDEVNARVDEFLCTAEFRRKWPACLGNRVAAIPTESSEPSESKALIPHLPPLVAQRTRGKSKVNFGSVMKKIKLEGLTKAAEPKTSYSQPIEVEETEPEASESILQTPESKKPKPAEKPSKRKRAASPEPQPEPEASVPEKTFWNASYHGAYWIDQLKSTNPDLLKVDPATVSTLLIESLHQVTLDSFLDSLILTYSCILM